MPLFKTQNSIGSSKNLSSLFGNKRDLFLFYFSPIALIFTFIQLYDVYFLNLNNSNRNLILSVLSNFVFFNYLHVPLTFLMIAFLPQFQKWSKTDKSSGPFPFWVNAIFIYLFFFLLVFLSGGFILSYSYGLLFFAVALIIRIYLGALHNLGQVYGLSVILNTNYITLNAGSPSRFDKLRNSEKIHIYIYTCIIVALQLVFAFSIFGDPNAYYPKSIWFLSLVGISLITIMSLFCTCLYYPKEMRQAKILLYLRLLLWPFEPISSVAFFARRANHGIEYMCVSTHMIQKEKFSNKKIVIFFSIYGLVIVVWLFFFLAELNLPKNDLSLDYFFKPFSLWQLFFSMRWAVDLTHYWTDSVIFKMKNEVTRKYIGPLLVKG